MPEREGVRVGLAVPQIVRDRGPSAAQLLRFVRRAEEAGVHSLWVCELTTAPILQPLGMLAFLAAASAQARLGVAVLLTALRDPCQLAAELSTIDRLSAGRLDVGVGLGSNPDLYPRHGLSARSRLRRYLDGLELLDLLWTQPLVTFHNEWWQLDDVPAGPAPVQRPHPPLWFGARRGLALRRAVELGAGWIGSGAAPPKEFANALRTVRAYLEAAGRDHTSFTVAKRVYLHVTDDPGPDRARARSWFAANYGNPDFADCVAVVGTSDQCLARLGELYQAGVDLLLLNSMFDEDEQLELLAEEVIPQLRSIC